MYLFLYYVLNNTAKMHFLKLSKRPKLLYNLEIQRLLKGLSQDKTVLKFLA